MGLDPTRFHCNLGVLDTYIKIYIKLMEKRRKFRARDSKLDFNKNPHAQPAEQENVYVAYAPDSDSELISTIPSVKRCEIKFSTIY